MNELVRATEKDDTWRSHVSICAQCRAVDVTRTANLAQLCLTGSKLVKDALNKLANSKASRNERNMPL